MKSEINEVIKKYADKKTALICLMILFGGLSLFTYDYLNDVKNFNGKLMRPEKEAATEKVFLDTGKDEKEEVSVKVSPRIPSEKEAVKYIEKAEGEIEETYLGKNKSCDKVNRKLQLNSVYANGMVSATWQMSDGRYIKNDGSLVYDEIEKEDGEVVVTAKVTLECGSESVVEEYPIALSMPSEKTAEGFEYYLAKTLSEADESTTKNKFMELPQKIGSVKLNWSKSRDNRGLVIAMLSIVAGLGIVFGRREEERRQAIKRQQELTKDYPGIVSMLSLYVSAGVTVRSAFKRIFSGYMNSRNRGSPERIGYEILGMILRKMDDGVGEIEAYSDYGRITENENYIKLSLLLTKNIKRGQKNLASLLEKEEAEAFFQRKMNAKKLGEEASTKLLVPMILLLGVVLVIMVAPAMFSLQM